MISTRRHLRMASFNIRHCRGADDILSLPRTARAIAALDADIIGLQEVDVCFDDRSDLADQAGALGDALGMNAVFGASLPARKAADAAGRAALGLPPAPDCTGYGNAILTRFPILDSRTVMLPVPSGGEQRSALIADLDCDGVRVRAVATHLSADGSAGAEDRAQQVAALRRELAGDGGGARAGSGADGPADAAGYGGADCAAEAVPAATILVGDMNCTPFSATYRGLTRDWRDARVEALRARTSAVRGAVGPVLGALVGAGARFAGGFTHSSTLPLRRIDLVLLRGAVRAVRTFVPSTRVSDHRPLVADLVITD
ncbi:endonuclease/exonuclease/phosphatase family protein [Helcobacillus massiliensis]|uniref:Endonuclease/exonuclease/phosphatase family metal-dependent hydrolase n=1 Tax=Helcobacillus massiliensis TaxID=521392 RepID=A0A839QTM7_9MICO|nr:endonuclease/exonuclease/phosphatase family protein [Helcobacillus massiliensis]MBB3023664.1 endonuclease/exonuclease/phosphatase family metal-dependent hydrolase [Helcobacillus massiliensis]